MGLLDSALQMLKGSRPAEEGGSGLAEAAMSILQGGQGRGLGEVLQAFHDKGFGDAVASWIGTGPNHPIGAEDLIAVLGSERVASIAKACGVSTEDASGQLASLLPKIVDGLTPHGSMPEGSALEQGLEMLKGRLKL
ncbi:hypothetical protein BWI17_11325 [Betaproteobacteria bacterium GR16-43]|nr:hypothetical protein BWI17_11325 [Betaproteobacteria bacterium GR16-43]